MGNKASSLEFPTEEVVRITSNVMELYAALYIKAYSVQLVEAMQRERAEEEDAEAVRNPLNLRLRPPPIGIEPLMTGWMTKLGEKTASWKRRFFVATNAADNYAVYYFEREDHQDAPSRRKGSIHPCGYSVRALKREEDTKEFGEFALVLEPHDRRRAWYLRCDSAEDRMRWKAVLRFAAAHAEPPLEGSGVENAAFLDAFERMRRQLGSWGYYRVDKPEAEQLSAFCAERCEALVLRRLLNSGAREDDKAREEAAEELHRATSGLVMAGWKVLQTRLGEHRERVEAAAKGSLAAAVREQERKREELRERLGPHLRTCAAESARPVLGHLVAALLRPTYKAFKEAVRIWWARINGIMERGLKETELRALFRNTRWQRGELWAAFRKLRAVTRGDIGDGPDGDPDLLKVLSELTCPLPELVERLDGVTLWELERVIETSIVDLIQWSIFSFVAEVESSPVSVSPEDCLRIVAARAISDARVRAREALLTCCRLVLCPATRRKAATVPQIRDALSTSAATAIPPYIPASATASAALADAAADEAVAQTDPTTTTTTTTTKTTAPPPSPSPSPSSSSSQTPTLRQSEKLLSTAIASAGAATADGFADTDWAIDQLITESVDDLVKRSAGEAIDATLIKLVKLEGKLGCVAPKETK